jgi:hypothetical protein
MFYTLFFYLSICEQVPRNASVILIVPDAVFGVKTCNKIGNRMVRSPYCLNLVGQGRRLLPFGDHFRLFAHYI